MAKDGDKPDKKDALKEKKDKSSSKTDKPEKKAKDKEGSKEKKEKSSKVDKPEKKDKKVSKENQPEPGPSRQPRLLKQPAAAPSSTNYLAGVDLPSSDEEEDDRDVIEREEKTHDLGQITHKEAKKIAEKERKAKERALALKREALVDDENVFDVAFEGMGDDRTAAHENATDVKVHNLTVRAKGKLLLEKTEVTIVAGRRYGLAGPNGKGKSTLLRLLARRQIPVPENIDIMLVEQEVQADDRSALEAVVQADFKLMDLRQQAHEIEEKLKDESLGDDEAAELGADLNEVYEELEAAGNSTAEARASRILYGLGFDEKMRGRSTKSFSGGWRMRISLARALYATPTLLLLDEPTNHLDLRAVLWLEEYLCRYKKTLVVVSHDRGFLNEVTTDIIHLHDLGLQYYRGNFASFEEMYEQRRRAQNKEFDKYEKNLKNASQGSNKEKMREATKKIERNQAKAQQKGAGKKGNKGFVEDDDTDATAKPRKWNDYQVKFDFPAPTELPTTQLLQLIDADFQYPGRDDFGMYNMNIGIGMGSRVCIVGPNGAGKSTLMNLLAGDLEPTKGEARKSIKLRVGRYAQHFVDALSMDDTPVEYLQRTFGHMRKEDDTELKEYDIRAMLGKFGLAGHHHHQPIVKLSGGQKARVVFVAIALSKPHILLLDEPTNHLDMQSIDALCDEVTKFGGGVVVISHDSTLLDALCSDEERSEVWIVENGGVKKWHSDFADYRESLVAEIKSELDEDDRNFKPANETVLLF